VPAQGVGVALFYAPPVFDDEDEISLCGEPVLYDSRWGIHGADMRQSQIVCSPPKGRTELEEVGVGAHKMDACVHFSFSGVPILLRFI
jgi:hypothetical protein